MRRRFASAASAASGGGGGGGCGRGEGDAEESSSVGGERQWWIIRNRNLLAKLLRT